MPFGVGDLDRRQLIFAGFLEVDSYQRQSHVSTASGRGLLPFLHPTGDLVESSHQRLEIVLKRRPWPER